MAGIGFELKKLFHRRGLMAMLRAYGYAGVICAGPMLLGVLLQFGVLIVSSWWQVGRPDRDLLVCMITYTLLASLVLTSFLSMPVTRFLADMLFDHDEKMILPSFWGSTGIMLVVGAVLYTVFLLFSGATLMQGALCLWLFLEMIVNWNAMSYLRPSRITKAFCILSWLRCWWRSLRHACCLRWPALLWSRCCSQWCLAMV